MRCKLAKITIIIMIITIILAYAAISAADDVRWYGNSTARIQLQNLTFGLGSLECYSDGDRIVHLTREGFEGPESGSLYDNRVFVQADGELLNEAKEGLARVDVLIHSVDARDHNRNFTCRWGNGQTITQFPIVEGFIHPQVIKTGMSVSFVCTAPPQTDSKHLSFSYSPDVIQPRFTTDVLRMHQFKNRIVTTKVLQTNPNTQRQRLQAVLTVQGVSIKDEGVYACTYNYKEEHTNTFMFNRTIYRLYVNSKADVGQIVSFDPDPLVFHYRVPQGSNLELRGVKRIGGFPNVSIKCLHNGSPDSGVPFVTVSHVTSQARVRRIGLNINPVTQEHAGMYYCLWGNSGKSAPRLDVFVLEVSGAEKRKSPCSTGFKQMGDMCYQFNPPAPYYTALERCDKQNTSIFIPHVTAHSYLSNTISNIYYLGPRDIWLGMCQYNGIARWDNGTFSYSQDFKFLQKYGDAVLNLHPLNQQLCLIYEATNNRIVFTDPYDNYAFICQKKMYTQ
ncbi:hypothetical protein [Ranid herpesvirus 3]|uniref:Ig-like domain-containing protein n=1 Tax=Ranid herpesvirus 3 TaxID=1987509 RepID=A0A1X9T548_9VIRU|nr:hypothetical protein [Ranid herpesvirus 3]ARR28823.1 hypothetical protein [Ranid herpesvirus 3]